MLKHVKKSLSVFLVLLLFFARVPGAVQTVQAEAPSPSSLSKNEKTRHVVCTELSEQAESYYTSGNTYEDLILLDGAKTTDSEAAIGSPLFNKLHNMMRLKNTVTYNSLTKYWAYTDSNAGSRYAWLIYDDVQATSDSSYDREHVWPKSNGNFYEDGAGSDIHHLRPCLPATNSTRGNHTFGDVRSKGISYSTRKNSNNEIILWFVSSYSGNNCSGLVEVKDDIKGDVARILLYVYVTYGDEESNRNLFTKCNASGSGNNQNDGEKIIESLDTLLRWVAIDPVDEWEMRRNDLSEDVQGNRNVFIDYPELAWFLFEREDEMPEMETPSGHASGSGEDYRIEAVSSDPEKGTVSVSGNTITASPKEGFRAADFEVIEGTADVTRNGNVFHVTPHSDCVIRILFEEKTRITLTYRVNGALYGTEEVFCDEPHVLPSEVSSPEGWTFSGWMTDHVERTKEKPEKIYTTEFTPERDTTLYALFIQSEEGGGSDEWRRMTDSSQLIPETKIVFAQCNSSRVAGELNSTYLEAESCGFSSQKDIIEDLPSTAKIFTLGGESGAWTFRTAEGKLLSCTSAKSLNLSGNGTNTWNISISGGNAAITNTVQGNGALQYNSQSPRFTTYTSNQTPIQIYYFAEGNTVYYCTEPDPQELPDVFRLSGSSRYRTAIEVANAVKNTLESTQDKTVDTVILASGDNFPDALTGSTLAAALSAPILLVGSAGKNLDLALSYIDELPEGAKVYILGGSSAVPETVEGQIIARREDVTVQRLFGANRYETNLRILEAAGADEGKLVVCSGTGYADALSASALGLPILIVKAGGLTESQKQYIQNQDFQEVCIMGGTSAVTEAVQSEIEALLPLASVQRISGSNRYKTSVAAAQTFCPDPDTIVAATGENYPDGLTGGVLAYLLKAPLLLVSEKKYADAALYTEKTNAHTYYILGGTGAIPEETVSKIVPGYQP